MLPSVAVWLLIAGSHASPPAERVLSDARLAIDAGRYAEAERLVRPLTSATDATALSLLARAKVGLGQGTDAETLDLAERAVATALATPGDGRELAAWEALALVLSDREDDLDAAEAQLEHCLGLVERGAGTAADEARLLETLVRLRLRRGLPFWAPMLRLERVAPAHVVLEIRARALREAGRYEHALNLARLGLDLRAAHGSGGAPLVDARLLVGELHWFLQQFESARDWHGETAGLVRTLWSEQHPAFAASVGERALCEYQLGEIPAARRDHELAVSILRRQRGSSHVETLGRLNNLANFVKNQGEYAEALGLYREVLDGVLAQPYVNPNDVATVEMNLAALQQEMGDRREAQQLLERVLRTWETSYRPDHPYLLHPLDALATLASERGDDAAARVLLQRVAGVLESQGTQGPLPLAFVQARLALVEERLGDRAAARGHADRAARAIAAAGAAEGLQVARIQQVLGERAEVKGQWLAAARLLRGEHARLEAVFGPRHPYVADSSSRLAQVLARAGSVRDAVALASASEATRRRHLRLTTRHLSETQALLFAGRRRSSLGVLVDEAVRSRAPSRVVRAFDAVWLSRALVLDEIAKRHRQTIAAPETELRQLLDQLEDARRRHAHLVWRATDPADVSADRMREADERVERLERRLGRLAPGLDDDREPSTAELASRIPAGAVLLSLARSGTGGDARYVAFVLRRGQAVPDLVPLGHAARIDRLATEWREALAARMRGLDDDDRETRAASGLRTVFWRPLEAALRGARLVLVVPEGPLALVNLAALPDGRGGYLLDGPLVVHTLSSERDLFRDPPEDGDGSLLAIGGPDFGTAAADAARSRAAEVPCGAGRLAPLLHAAKEAEAVAQNWKDGVPRVLTGAAATESAFRELAKGKSALHVATHAFACDRRDAVSPLLRSGLALAGANASGDETDDGILTAAEISGLDLSTARWVVLSTCSSGLGDVQSEEGVLGLRRAFTIAGARTLVTSLWPVDDHHAREYMGVLYAVRASGKPAAEVAWEASRVFRSLLRDTRRPDSPALWAPFVTSGDWR